jgi:hypothetical protein
VSGHTRAVGVEGRTKGWSLRHCLRSSVRRVRQIVDMARLRGSVGERASAAAAARSGAKAKGRARHMTDARLRAARPATRRRPPTTHFPSPYTLSDRTMNAFVSRFSTTGADAELRKARAEADDAELGDADAAWGSAAGFGALAHGAPSFAVPAVPDVRLYGVLICVRGAEPRGSRRRSCACTRTTTPTRAARSRSSTGRRRSRSASRAA